MNNELFRKVSLDRLSSPEQIDQMVAVTTPKTWLTLIGIVIILITAIIWSIFGAIPITVNGQGILISGYGIQDIIHTHSGQVTDIRVKVGDQVKRGEIVARIDQPQLVASINDYKSQLNDLTNLTMDRPILANNQQVGPELFDFYTIIRNISQARESVKNAQANYDSAASEKTYSGDSEDTILDRKAALQEARLNLQLLEEQFSSTKAIKIAELEKKIAKMQDQLELNSSVISQVDGRVLEILVKKGDLISPGMSLMSLERVGKTANLDVIMYVSAETGKNIFPGMEAQISPSTVQKEESGFMLGRVVSVSEFPSTAQGMLLTLGSKEMVNKFEQDVSLEVRIDIVADDSTVSGYKWSSGRGPAFKIGSGTFCTGSIILKKQRPISMIIP
ncbi:MAG TPA: NHLP bacteriocin system secretion protein [Syntrophomonadaceae bacterium]|nr:NHLP bacteriocin system secretion protein [Syntrophomonadaceae bacterium]